MYVARAYVRSQCPRVYVCVGVGYVCVYVRCGALAVELSGNKLRIGYHKVEGRPQAKDGLMMVYEVCSFEQIPQDIPYMFPTHAHTPHT